MVSRLFYDYFICHELSETMYLFFTSDINPGTFNNDLKRDLWTRKTENQLLFPAFHKESSLSLSVLPTVPMDAKYLKD